MKHLPNILTIIRLFLVPLFAVVFFSDSANAHNYALAIFLLAGATDVLDGKIARKYNLITKVGTVLDPLADKLMLLTALTCLTIDGTLPIWVLAIVIAKECYMILTGLYMYFKKTKMVIPSNIFGKAATVIFTLAVVLLILLPDSNAGLAVAILAITLKFTALGSYIFHYNKHLKPGARR